MERIAKLVSIPLTFKSDPNGTLKLEDVRHAVTNVYEGFDAKIRSFQPGQHVPIPELYVANATRLYAIDLLLATLFSLRNGRRYPIRVFVFIDHLRDEAPGHYLSWLFRKYELQRGANGISLYMHKGIANGLPGTPVQRTDRVDSSDPDVDERYGITGAMVTYTPIEDIDAELDNETRSTDGMVTCHLARRFVYKIEYAARLFDLCRVQSTALQSIHLIVDASGIDQSSPLYFMFEELVGDFLQNVYVRIVEFVGDAMYASQFMRDSISTTGHIETIRYNRLLDGNYDPDAPGLSESDKFKNLPVTPGMFDFEELLMLPSVKRKELIICHTYTKKFMYQQLPWYCSNPKFFSQPFANRYPTLFVFKADFKDTRRRCGVSTLQLNKGLKRMIKDMFLAKETSYKKQYHVKGDPEEQKRVYFYIPGIFEPYVRPGPLDGYSESDMDVRMTGVLRPSVTRNR